MCEQLAPFSAYRTAVREEWLDYNGHMHDSSYAVVLSDANEQLFSALGLSAEYQATTGASFYTVECHIRYLAECTLGQVLTATSIVVAANAKKIRVYTELLLERGDPVATGEHLYLHVDAALGETTAMPADRHQRVQDMVSSHAGLPRPAHLGLGVGAARASSGQP